MRNFVSIFVLCVFGLVNTDVLAATGRGGRTGGQQQSSGTPVSARAATRSNVKQSVVQNNNVAGVSARAAVKTSANNNVVKPNGARAASTQKVVSNSTKVAVATTNTIVSQECQTAYYGCMDSFCMLDNVSGGRCLCSDRKTELDAALAEIEKLNNQSYKMATEGVERIEMGDKSDVIMSKAEAIEKDALKEKEQTETNSKTVRKTLDLASWNSVSFADDEDEQENSISEELMNKTGDDLQIATAKICADKIPQECKDSASMLFMAYSQKIKSDCAAYESSVKQQKTAAEQNLATAKQSLREAALAQYENENKYGTLGECVSAYDTCMQQTAGCGSDYSSCVGDYTVLSSNADYSSNKKNSKMSVKKIGKIEVSLSTYEMLSAKAPLCESVLNRCKNVRDGVWNSFLSVVAPKLKSAEYSAESDRRMQCVNTVVKCVKTYCNGQWDEDTDNYDMCLSNPDSINVACELEINKCGASTAGSNVMEYITAKLSADRVDACTEEVKECLQSEDRCGSDYSNCIGLSTDTIVDMCTNTATNAKLMACQSKFSNDAVAVKDYVAQVAQGVILNIDNSFYDTCKKAADTAMTEVCGETTSCNSLSVSVTDIDKLLQYKLCQVVTSTDDNGIQSTFVNGGMCRENVSTISEQDLGLDTVSASTESWQSYASTAKSSWGFGAVGLFFAVGGGGSKSQTSNSYTLKTNYTLKSSDKYTYSPIISGIIDWGTISYEDGEFKYEEGKHADEDMYATDDKMKQIIATMNSELNKYITRINSDQKVKYCMEGRQVMGVTTSSTNVKTLDTSEGAKRFPNLTDNMRDIIATKIWTSIQEVYENQYNEYIEQRLTDLDEIGNKIASVAAKNSETALDSVNATSCEAKNRNVENWNYQSKVTATYSNTDNSCKICSSSKECAKEERTNDISKRYCSKWKDAVESCDTVKM